MRELTTDEAREVQLMLETGTTGLLISMLGLMVLEVLERGADFDAVAIQINAPSPLTPYELDGFRAAARRMHEGMAEASPEERKQARVLYTAHLAAAGVKTAVVDLQQKES